MTGTIMKFQQQHQQESAEMNIVGGLGAERGDVCVCACVAGCSMYLQSRRP
eukprot:SAG25_NODE_10039_length_348_cov_0.594378_2_plen_50_part_01